MSEIPADVFTVERIGQLTEKASSTLAGLGYSNVHVMHGDGTRGWSAHAPYDAIAVAAGGPFVPEALKRQLKIGGRLVMPIDPRTQELIRVTRLSETEFRSEDIADVRFVPPIGHEGWQLRELEEARVYAPQACGPLQQTGFWFVALRTLRSRSRRLKRRTSVRCWNELDRIASCCSEKRRMEVRNSYRMRARSRDRSEGIQDHCDRGRLARCCTS